MKKQQLLVILVILAMVPPLLLIQGCKKNQVLGEGQLLRYSSDTVFFDTVFTSVGSITQAMKIYNDHPGIMHIQKLSLRGGQQSNFRIALDGDNGVTFSDYELASGDSAYIMVEVTVDPNQDLTPFIIEDYIDLEYNGQKESIYLAAFGQNAHFHGGPDALTTLNCNESWSADLPHVVYGVLEVESGCDLVIQAGTHVYLHKGSGILINGGTLHVNGEKGNEVQFTGDRLDGEYTSLPGMWGIELDFQIGTSQGPDVYTISRGGIWIYKSPGSVIDYAVVKNGNTGIQVDTTGTSNFALTISNTKIDNMAGVGLWAQGAHVKATNLLITNCAEGCAYLSIGGKYEMDNCTFANYWTNGTRTAPAFALNNYYKDINDQIQVRPLYGCIFRNCIMYGNNANLSEFDETVIDLELPDLQAYQFSYCLVDTEADLTDIAHWDNCINHQAPYWCDAYGGDFHVSTNASRMTGGPYNAGVLDLDQQESGFWKGCYDFIQACQ